MIWVFLSITFLTLPDAARGWRCRTPLPLGTMESPVFEVAICVTRLQCIFERTTVVRSSRHIHTDHLRSATAEKKSSTPPIHYFL
ncbi:hypothetical protein EDB80DRAFT_41535 [Ilyonectria destructans]|nr:hypothetical protein EDB80DRAFT_41535 [Ilyonectria destructans]